MPPKKKKAGGDAAGGERIFKNLCSACHSLSVRTIDSVNTPIVSLSRASPRWNWWFKHSLWRGFQLLLSPCSQGHSQVDRW